MLNGSYIFTFYAGGEIEFEIRDNICQILNIKSSLNTIHNIDLIEAFFRKYNIY